MQKAKNTATIVIALHRFTDRQLLPSCSASRVSAVSSVLVPQRKPIERRASPRSAPCIFGYYYLPLPILTDPFLFHRICIPIWKTACSSLHSSSSSYTGRSVPHQLSDCESLPALKSDAKRSRRSPHTYVDMELTLPLIDHVAPSQTRRKPPNKETLPYKIPPCTYYEKF